MFSCRYYKCIYWYIVWFRCLNATERCTYNWVAASEFDIPDNAKVYTDEEIEDLEIFRKSHYSECHNKG